MWQDRIREAAYESPSGIRTIFGGYEDVSMTAEKKTTAFDFPDADGTYIQDLGPKGRIYPMRLFFWGDDYDQQSNAFFDSLLEVGAGKLEHPVYGVSRVVPFGRIKRRDDLVSAANQAVFELSFWETNELIYPLVQQSTGALARSSVKEFASTSAGLFDRLDTSTAIKLVTFRNQVLSQVNAINSILSPPISGNAGILGEFTNIYDSITRNINITSPDVMAYQIIALFQSASKGDVSAKDYSAFTPTNQAQDKNDLFVSDLFAMASVSGAVSSALSATYTSKPQAISAAESVLSQFDSLVLWRDDQYQSLDEVDAGEAYQALQESVALIAAYLVQLSFSLLQEKTITLDRDRTMIDLCAELYGSVDGRLDFMISTNDFSGSEILEIKRGREIVYYV